MGNLNFKLRIVFWNIFFWRFGNLKKRIALSEKKPPLQMDLFDKRAYDCFYYKIRKKGAMILCRTLTLVFQIMLHLTIIVCLTFFHPVRAY